MAVHWANGDRTYWYCDFHAEDVLAHIGGTEDGNADAPA